MPNFPSSSSLSSAWLANEVYVSPGGSNSSSGKAGAPKRTIYDGLEKLISLGGGTLNCDSQCDVGGPVLGQGIWLRNDFLPDSGYYFPVPGFLPLVAPIRILGRGKDAPAGPFTIAPTTNYNGGGSSQFKPALWLVGSPVTGQAFEMVNMQSSWGNQAVNAVIPPELRAGKLGARIQVDFDRELDGSVKQVPVLNATRTGTSTVLTVDIDSVTAVAVSTVARAAGVVTLTMANPGLPFFPWTKRVHIRLASTDAQFPAGDKNITFVNNWAAGNSTWTIKYLEAGDEVETRAPVGSMGVHSHGCCAGELIWLSSSNVHFPSQQYYVSSVTDDTVTIFDNFGDGDADEDDIGTIAHQERRRVPLVNTRFERCSQGIDSSFYPVGATHSWDVGSNLAVLPELIGCWGEGSISGGGLPNYDWRNFAAYYSYGGSGGGEDDAGASALLQRFMCNNGGICAEASPFGAVSRLIARDCLVEQASFESTLPGILFRGNSFSSVYVSDFLNADGNPDNYAVEITSTPVSGAIVERSGRVNGPCIGGDNWQVPGAWGTGGTFENPWTEQQVTPWADGRIAGKHPGAARALGIVAARYANVVNPASSWTADAGVTITPGGGVAGPDGMATDLITTTGVSNVTITSNNAHGVTVAEGGKLVFCCWINSDTSLRDGLVSYSSNQFTVPSTGPGFSGPGWQFVQTIVEVGTVSASPPNWFVNLTFPAAATVSIYGVTVVYVPETVPDNDAFEFAGTIKAYPRYLAAGTAGTMEGQRLHGDGGLTIGKSGYASGTVELFDGSSAAVSASGSGALRYNAGTNKIQYSKNGGAWTDLV